MPEYAKFVKQRAVTKASLTRFSNTFASRDPNEGLGSWRSRLLILEELYKKYDEIQTNIEMLVMDDVELSDKQSQERLDFENPYFNLITQVNDLIALNSAPFSTSGQINQNEGLVSQISSPLTVQNIPVIETSNIKLPTITLPQFDGAFKDWLIFRDTFQSLIHDNTRLSKIQKFHYLNSALTGDAARVIQSLGVSESNYELAWNSLVERYEDSSSLTHYHIKALFDTPCVTKLSFVTLRQLIDDTNNHLLSLKSLGEKIESWDTVIIYLLTTKLDQFSKREWEKYVLTLSNKPTFKNMTTFLETHCKYLQKTMIEKQETSNNHVNKNKPNSKGTYSKGGERLASHATTKKSCPLCNENHALYNCEKLLKLPVEERIQEVMRLRVCFNCLSLGHRNKQCTFGPCKKCPAKHNTLLHRDRTPQEPTTDSETTSEIDTNVKTILLTKASSREHILFGTAIVWIRDRQGNRHECRALLDSCSQVHLMTRNLCQRLKLPLSTSDVVISGVGNTTYEPQHSVSVTIESTCTGFSENIECLVTSEITEDMPNIPLRQNDIEVPSGITLADPAYFETRPVDLLISAGLFWKLLCVGQIKLRDDQPIIQKTQLGWIIAGPMELRTQKPKKQLSCNLITNQQLHDDLSKFWEIENFTNKHHYPELDKLDISEKHFLDTFQREPDGRCVVSMALKDNVNDLGESRKMAEKRLFAMERKFKKQPEIKKRYIEFMEDYENQGHMEPIPTEDQHTTNPTCYLPHHAVFKESSTTSDIRVVYDGSSETSTGVSLNDTQHTGPTVQCDLFSIVIRFRQHKIVLSADIAQMYRQIRITRNQQDLQRILWRKDSTEPIQEYRLTTVTYGTTSAPFLATRTLRQIGEENKEKFPIMSEIIIGDFYVDDLLTGGESLEEIVTIKNQLNKLLSDYGFVLRKWCSNDNRVFENEDLIDKNKILHDNKEPKTLGLVWNSNQDKLKYAVKQSTESKFTKRKILSRIAQIFDILGLVGPAVIKAKILMQRIWQLRLDWDESLPQELHTAWKEYSEQLSALNDIIIERRVIADNARNIQLHGFSDASETAYGACIFLRSTDESNKHHVHLLCAKSRVAPIKKITLPRLELLGAALLAQLSDSVCRALTIKLDNKFFWSDSTIVLQWIKSPPNHWKTFVANRTSEIQTLTNGNWNHVSSSENPADLISRGINPTDLQDNKLWWNGPEWLSQNEESWTNQENERVLEMPEERKRECTLLVNTVVSFSLLERFSKLTSLIRVTAYCMRFINNAKRRLKLTGSLTVLEINCARSKLLKLAQLKDFETEINCLKQGKPISNKSKLLCLNPFLDTEGLLRVGGRLENAPVPFNQKHPIILSPNNPLTCLLIQYEHLRLLHAGCQTVMASLRTKYWPIACKNAVKGILRKCIKCFKMKPSKIEYIMANLPTARVTPERPFYTSGVDYAGPFYLVERSRSRTQIKAYICIFVCFATKAVHIELAHNLSTDAFLNCLRRFVSRRGLCKNIFSDNGTNFVGAKNELKELKSLLSNSEFQENVLNFLSNQQIEWSMIPPAAPHFGGLWESAVKSAKHHLYRVVGETRLTYEELYTVLTQVEACLNSRPLSPLSTDPNDLTPLTPGHFLIGDSLLAVPEPDLRHIKQNRLNRYQHLQQMTQHFWQRWQKEYLSQLQLRNKWSQPQKNNILPGTLVVIREDNLPPSRWRIGRIIELHPGRDNVTRVVSIRLANTIIKRPISKVCILPIEEGVNED